MSKRSRQKQRSLTQYSADDFSASSESDDELPRDPKRSKSGLHNAYVSSLSSDRRRIISKPISLAEPTPVKRAQQAITEGIASMSMQVDVRSGQGSDGSSTSSEASTSNSEGDDESNGSRESDGERDSDGDSSGQESNRPWVGIGGNSPEPAQPTERSGRPHKQRYAEDWMRLRQEYLTMLMIGEGTWNGLYFERVSLTSLGLVVQLGHLSNSQCPAPNTRAPQNFTVLHTNGFHRVRVYYCECGQAGELSDMRQQLLTHRWYPATTRLPQTCFTFRLLEHFHMMTLVGKITSYDYYRGLEKLTNNVGDFSFKNRYDSFRRAAREWQHLKALKRGGRGNDSARTIQETKTGELAVLCPACPRPEVNLPGNWISTEPEKSFIYTLFLAVDACFRLKRKMVSSEAADPGLGTGWSYMVPDEPYRRYLLSTTNESEMSTCSGLAALDHANSRNSRGTYATSGVGLGCCARHEFIQPTGVGDLQKGECRRFVERLSNIPEENRLEEIPEFLFVIPKLHVYGHTTRCQLYYSLNYAVGVGRTDGEGVERNWAGQGPIATSTTEMGPGSRHDTLDDHWGYWNWEKLVGLGTLLLRRLKLALEWRGQHEASYRAYVVNQPSNIPEWMHMVEEFEKDSWKPNPYELPKSGLNMQDVRLQLVQEELAQTPLIATSEEAEAATAKGPVAFMLLALEVEERQRQLRQDVKWHKKGSSARQAGNIVDQRLQLRRLISRFEAQQVHFMPIISSVRIDMASQSKEVAEVEVEDVPIYLPSSLTVEQRAACPAADFGNMELRLRNAQCSESLDELRNQLLIKSRLRTYKSSQARHQKDLRQSSHLLQLNEEKISLHAKRYQDAWDSIQRLQGDNVPWRRLEKTDIRCMEDPEDQAVGVARKKLGKRSKQTGQLRAKEISSGPSQPHDGENSESTEESGPDDTPAKVEKRWRKKRDEMVRQTGEGFREVSWIWWAADGGGFVSDESLYNGLRVEWAKLYARLRRWKEEVHLVEEEMRRVLVSLEWNAKRWDRRAQDMGFTGIHAEGVSSYAHRQAALFHRLKGSFARLWKQDGDHNLEREDEQGDKEEAANIEDGYTSEYVTDS
ncbi:hypothetical protein VNI00_016115 [Paramarasmius palmivorus]|uniref:CxC2-like cysteine cluster KDZ transposase-associated domain-containing protein n=1 Tax=Paramarasmius palmivorus TaxID=297713 RepID=A0AAW0BHS0_9AGAR